MSIKEFLEQCITRSIGISTNIIGKHKHSWFVLQKTFKFLSSDIGDVPLLNNFRVMWENCQSNIIVWL